MTTLTDEQARELAQEYLSGIPNGDETLGNIKDGCAMARYILSRPSSGVQPISGDVGNAGQPGGAAHAGWALKQHEAWSTGQDPSDAQQEKN